MLLCVDARTAFLLRTEINISRALQMRPLFLRGHRSTNGHYAGTPTAFSGDEIFRSHNLAKSGIFQKYSKWPKMGQIYER